jgi:hypothetical protein
MPAGLLTRVTRKKVTPRFQDNAENKALCNKVPLNVKLHGMRHIMRLQGDLQYLRRVEFFSTVDI